MEKLPKNQKEYYHNKIRDYEKRTGKSMNVKGVSQFYDYKIEDAEYNFQAALDLMQKHACYIYNDSMVVEDPMSNGTHWRKYGFAHVNNKTYIWNDLRTGNPVKQEHIDAVMKVKNDVTTLSSILPYYLNKPL